MIKALANALRPAWILPLLLTALAVFVNALHTSFRLNADGESLSARYQAQETTLADAHKLREQLEAIAADTASLADQGNPSAIRLRDYLQQQGITIRRQRGE